MEKISALLAICAENSPVTGEFLAQRPVTRSFDVFFDLHLNEQLSQRDAGDLRCHCAHYDITVMSVWFPSPGANNMTSISMSWTHHGPMLCCPHHYRTAATRKLQKLTVPIVFKHAWQQGCVLHHKDNILSSQYGHFYGNSTLTHLPLVLHDCISELCHHWFR